MQIISYFKSIIPILFRINCVTRCYQFLISILYAHVTKNTNILLHFVKTLTKTHIKLDVFVIILNYQRKVHGLSRAHLRFVGYSSGVYKNTALNAAVIAIFPVKEKATDAVIMSLLPSEIKRLL